MRFTDLRETFGSRFKRFLYRAIITFLSVVVGATILLGMLAQGLGLRPSDIF